MSLTLYNNIRVKSILVQDIYELTAFTMLQQFFCRGHSINEIQLIEGAKLTTDQGHMVEFRFQLIPADMK